MIMKNLTLIALFGVLLFGFTNTNAQQVAHVNSVTIFESMPDYKAAQTKLKNEADRHKAEVERQTKEIQTIFNDAQQQLQAAQNATEAEQKALMEKLQPVEADLQKKQQTLQEYQQNAAKELNEMEKNLLGPIYEKVQNAIDAVGKAKNVGYIIDVAEAGPQGIVVYFGNGTDLNPDVKKQLGL